MGWFDNPIGEVTNSIGLGNVTPTFDNLNGFLNPGDSALDQIGQKQASVNAKLLAEALADPTIDDQTKEDLKKGIFVMGTLEKDVQAARSQTGIFATRMRNQQYFNLIKDRPGTAQTNIANRVMPSLVEATSSAGIPALTPGGIDIAGVSNNFRTPGAV